FGELRRAQWLKQKFASLGLEDVEIDEVGNVVGVSPGSDAAVKKCVAVTAHIDTVFPDGTKVEARRDGERLYGPGVSDNAAGVTAMLALASALQAARIRHSAPILFVGNVGEEGEGDVRGMRFLFSQSPWKERISATLVIDGAGTDSVVTQALGSRRFLVTVRGPGGHSWSDFGIPNPIIVLARAIDKFSRVPVPLSPKTTFNIGVISGGTSVNSIPESASMRVDIRSASVGEIERLEEALRAALEGSVAEATRSADKQAGKRNGNPDLSYEIQLIGDRPAAELNPNARIYTLIHAVDQHLGNRARVQRASTDANIPISLGYEALAIGAGGRGGGAHTIHEWYDPTGRDLGLKRILLSVLALSGVPAPARRGPASADGK
ncbi:MAG TPA: M20/M25/M40 family metallo-hydrolase, partial [Terriglobales bacterium]|nr:M20/M25/M40 family metallo-hydrolase [Terriglobales bacterium]